MGPSAPVFRRRWVTPQRCENFVGRRAEVSVFPYSDDSPALPCETFVGRLIPGDVPGDLLDPIILVRRWHPTMGRAPVPEATVDEDRQTLTLEGQIRHDWPAFRKLDLLTEPEASATGMQLRSKPDLRPRIG